MVPLLEEGLMVNVIVAEKRGWTDKRHRVTQAKVLFVNLMKNSGC
jgi:hypothetical protein